MPKIPKIAILLVALASLMTANAASLDPHLVGDPTDPDARADGKTAVLTPDGTTIIPPPGAPLLIVREDPANYTTVVNGDEWGPLATFLLSEAHEPGTATAHGAEGETMTASISGCTSYKAGWYETDSSSLYGGHVGIKPQNMPPNPLWYCSGKGMGYTDAVSFSPSSWIQAGLATFAGETGAKWFCQSNDSGSTSTSYGSASAYGNGATVYTWFSRDSGGTWRTYRYDTGPYSVQLPCSIVRGASGNLQTFGEIQGATSTSAPMGPWDMFDVRYQSTSGSWYVPTTMQAYYPGSTPCPPYGAGTISSGSFSPGSGATCSTGTSSYP